MLNPLKKAIIELKLSISKAHLFEKAINSIIIFLASYFAFTKMNLPIHLSIAILLAYITVSIAKTLNLNKIGEAEYYYPRLNERLRTAAEHASEETPVVNELKQEVLMELRHVEEAEFVDDKKLMAKTGIIALLCFLILLLSPVSFDINLIKPAIREAITPGAENYTTQTGDAEPGIGAGPGGGAIMAASEDIYGIPSIAKIGNEEIPMVIKPAGDTIDIRQAKEVEKRDFSETYPKEVFATATSSYNERIPKEQQEMVKNYFTALAQD